MTRMVRPLAVAAAVLALGTPAAAHVTVQPMEAVTGSFARFVVRVPNERPDAATTKVEVQFPESLTLVTFQDVAGWQRRVERKTLPRAVEVFGQRVTEYVATVTWEGGRIEPGEFEEFGFSTRMPERPSTLRFSALQTYDSGEVVRWVGPPDAEEPAALVTTVDLPGPEGAGELQVLAELARAGGVDDGGDGSATSVVLGGVAVALAAVALVVALARRRSA